MACRLSYRIAGQAFRLKSCPGSSTGSIEGTNRASDMRVGQVWAWQLHAQLSKNMVAVSRLVMGDVPQAHCTHEPHSASLMAGANLFFPEVGSSPRDGHADTGKGRGQDFSRCHQLQREMELDPMLPSNCF